MADSRRGKRLTEDQRQEQIRIRAAFLQRFFELWPLMDPYRVDETGRAWIQTVMPLIAEYRELSAQSAETYYRDFRMAEAPTVALTNPVPQIERVGRGTSQRRPRQGRTTGDPPADNPEPQTRSQSRRGQLRPVRIIWDDDDKAAEASLETNGPRNIKSKTKRGQTAEQAAREAMAQAGGAAGRHVLEGGRKTELELVNNDDECIGYVRVTDGDPCAWCAMLSSRGPTWKPYRSAQSATRVVNPKANRAVGSKYHDNCVLPGTQVTGPSVDVAYRRQYEGEVIVVGLSSGAQVSITPNHPVLTDRGWVEAGLLREGDDVACRFGADLESLQVPHEHEVPAPIEDVWRALAVDGLARVPASAEDFHGDGVFTQGDIDVVATDRFLTAMRNTTSAEEFAQKVRAGALGAAVLAALPSERAPFARLVTAAHSPKRSMRSGGVGAALLTRETTLMETPRLARAAPFDALFAEPSLNYGAGHSEPLGDGLFGGIAVEGRKVDSRRRFDPTIPGPLAARTGRESPSAQRDAQRLVVHAELGRALLERMAGGVQLDRVVNLRRIDYSGHVFNLRTVEGWYDANGIIVSNCACTAEPVFAESQAWPGRSKEFRDLWNEVASGQKDPLNAFRRELERQRRERERTGEAEPGIA